MKISSDSLRRDAQRSRRLRRKLAREFGEDELATCIHLSDLEHKKTVFNAIQGSYHKPSRSNLRYAELKYLEVAEGMRLT